MLTYIFVPISIILIGIELLKSKGYKNLSKIAIACGLFCISLIGLLLTNPFTQFAELYQRMIEGTFIIWIIACAIFIKTGQQYYRKQPVMNKPLAAKTSFQK